MGGAERNARKRKQEAAAQRAVAAARKAKSDRNKVVITVVVVLVIAIAVVVGLLVTNSKKNEAADVQIPVDKAASLEAKRDGAVVVVGKDTAKITVDVYEDFLCPYCKQFEQSSGQQLEQKIQDGTVRVRYHILTLLNNRSDPPGYSLDSANAALLAAEAGQFPAFHKSLFAAQPEEGARGYDKNQLIKLGQDVGITSPDFAAGVNAGKYNQIIEDAYQAASNDPKLKQDFGGGQVGFGTPTILVNDKIVNALNDPNWLNTAVSQTP